MAVVFDRFTDSAKRCIREAQLVVQELLQHELADRVRDCAQQLRRRPASASGDGEAAAPRA